ncbi:MAG: hypothetical protein ACQKBT_03115, partial [Puniceicoccales bacterium]
GNREVDLIFGIVQSFILGALEKATILVFGNSSLDGGIGGNPGRGATLRIVIYAICRLPPGQGGG